MIAEGPMGVFTAGLHRREKALLVAGGIGITPIRALVEEMDGDFVVVYRVLQEDDAVLLGELEKLAAERGFALELVAGDHATEEGRALLTRPTCSSSCPTWSSARCTSAARRRWQVPSSGAFEPSGFPADTSMSRSSPSETGAPPIERRSMRRHILALTTAAALAVPVVNAAAAVNNAAKATVKKVVTKKYAGAVEQADRWGTVEVTVTVQTTTAGSKVTRKYTDLGGSYTYHTGRSQFIMSTALPRLRSEFLSAQRRGPARLGCLLHEPGIRASLQSALAKAGA